MRFQPEVKISIGLIIAFMLVVTGTGFAYFNTVKAIQYGKSVESGLELLAALESLLQVIRVNQRTGIAYATTGNTNYLTRFEQSNKSVSPHIQFIKGLAATDTRRYTRLTGLEAQVRSFNTQIGDLVQKRKKKDENIVVSDKVKTV